MHRFTLLLVGLPFVLGTLHAQDGPKSLVFAKEDVTFSVPSNYSPVRTVRLRFHPTEPKLVAQVSDKRLAVWDLNAKPMVAKGKKEATVLPEYHAEQKEGWITGFDIHPSGQWLITGGSDRKLRKWVWADRSKPVVEVEGHQGWIEAVAFSPGGKVLATAGSDLKVRIWDLEGLKVLETYSAHARPIRDLGWSPDGTLIYTGAEDGKILVFDLAAKKIVRELEFGNVNEQQGQDPAQSGVFRLVVSRDGQWLAASGQNKSALYSLKTGNLVAAENLGFDNVFYPEGPFVIAGFNDTKVMRFDPVKLDKLALDPLGKKGKTTVPAGETIANLKRNNGYGLAVHSDGSRVAAAIGESTVGLWKVTRK